VPGKIVVFNQDYIGYHETAKYRWAGASEASKLGAVAVLVRSITPFSIGSPHTGIMAYEENVKPIPAACISIENAQMLDRMHRRGTFFLLPTITYDS
jgi:carboxypeptidase Q